MEPIDPRPPAYFLDKWEPITRISQGSTCTVLLVEDIQARKALVIKLFNKGINPKISQNEAQVLLSMSHPGVIACSGYYPRVLIPLPVDVNAPDLSFPCECYSALALEYAPNGDLLELVTMLGCLPEVVARTFFHQLIDAIEYLHNAGICHLDIKPDNILIAQDFALKLSDFGTALESPVTYLVKGVAGTPKYFSPEMHEDSFYSGFQADLFALGIVLFSMVNGRMPFAAAKPSDAIYRLLAQRNYDDFWKIHESSRGKMPQSFSKTFRDLIQGMLELNPEKRISLKDIKAHNWFNEPILDQKDLSLLLQALLEKQKAFDKVLLLSLEYSDNQRPGGE